MKLFSNKRLMKRSTAIIAFVLGVAVGVAADRLYEQRLRQRQQERIYSLLQGVFSDLPLANESLLKEKLDFLNQQWQTVRASAPDLDEEVMGFVQGYREIGKYDSAEPTNPPYSSPGAGSNR